MHREDAYPAPPTFRAEVGPFPPCILCHSLTTISICAIAAERLLSTDQRNLAGNEFPPHLDGSLPGDAGFDPLSLGSDPTLLKWCAFYWHGSQSVPTHWVSARPSGSPLYGGQT